MKQAIDGLYIGLTIQEFFMPGGGYRFSWIQLIDRKEIGTNQDSTGMHYSYRISVPAIPASIEIWIPDDFFAGPL